MLRHAKQPSAMIFIMPDACLAIYCARLCYYHTQRRYVADFLLFRQVHARYYAAQHVCRPYRPYMLRHAMPLICRPLYYADGALRSDMLPSLLLSRIYAAFTPLCHYATIFLWYDATFARYVLPVAIWRFSSADVVYTRHYFACRFLIFMQTAFVFALSAVLIRFDLCSIFWAALFIVMIYDGYRVARYCRIMLPTRLLYHIVARFVAADTARRRWCFTRTPYLLCSTSIFITALCHLCHDICHVAILILFATLLFFIILLPRRLFRECFDILKMSVFIAAYCLMAPYDVWWRAILRHDAAMMPCRFDPAAHLFLMFDAFRRYY